MPRVYQIAVAAPAVGDWQRVIGSAARTRHTGAMTSLADPVALEAELLAPLTGDSPVGPDLSYSNERAFIEEPLALHIADCTVGRHEWERAWGDILAQFAHTRDLSLAAYLTRVAAHLGDLPAIALGFRVLAGLLELHWADVHPTLDEVDFIGRRNVVEQLTRERYFLTQLRDVPLLRAADDEADADGADDIAAREQLASIRGSAARIDAVLTAQAGHDDTGIDFAPLYATLDELDRALAPLTTRVGDWAAGRLERAGWAEIRRTGDHRHLRLSAWSGFLTVREPWAEPGPGALASLERASQLALR